MPYVEGLMVESNQTSSGVCRDPQKAKKFFEFAMRLYEKAKDGHPRHYGIVIECYLNGLRHQPGNLKAHQELLEVGMRRKVSGCGPADYRDRLWWWQIPSDPIERMLYAQRLWIKDPLSLSLMTAFMEEVSKADRMEPGLGLDQVANWIQTQILDRRNESGLV